MVQKAEEQKVTSPDCRIDEIGLPKTVPARTPKRYPRKFFSLSKRKPVPTGGNLDSLSRPRKDSRKQDRSASARTSPRTRNDGGPLLHRSHLLRQGLSAEGDEARRGRQGCRPRRLQQRGAPPSRKRWMPARDTLSSFRASRAHIDARERASRRKEKRTLHRARREPRERAR